MNRSGIVVVKWAADKLARREDTQLRKNCRAPREKLSGKTVGKNGGAYFPKLARWRSTIRRLFQSGHMG
jgi:hypothetical protein